MGMEDTKDPRPKHSRTEAHINSETGSMHSSELNGVPVLRGEVDTSPLPASLNQSHLQLITAPKGKVTLVPTKPHWVYKPH